MANELQTVNQNTAVAVAEDYKKIALEWLDSTGNLKKFTENEKSQFCDMCTAYGLNPIKKEIYGIKYGDKFNMIVGFETYLKRAERTHNWDGYESEFSGSGDDLTCTVKIYRKDWTRPYTHSVILREYKGQGLWTTKPRTMLEKVALSQGFRRAFPDEMGGMPYTAEELRDMEKEAQPAVKPATVTKTETKPTEQKKTKIAPKYTQEQAQEIGSILGTKYGDGTDMFTEADRETYRTMLKTEGGEKTLEAVKTTLADRMQSYETGEIY